MKTLYKIQLKIHKLSIQLKIHKLSIKLKINKLSQCKKNRKNKLISWNNQTN